MVQFSHLYVTTGKTIALIIRTFVGKRMALLFNILSRFGRRLLSFSLYTLTFLFVFFFNKHIILLQLKNKVHHYIIFIYFLLKFRYVNFKITNIFWPESLIMLYISKNINYNNN